MKTTSVLGLLCVASVLTLAGHGPVVAQTVSLRGRAVDPQGAPVAGLEVLLHRVAGGSGANVARDTTAEDGSFILTAENAAQDSAVFFAAARYRNELFVGEFVRPPFDPASSYTLVVGGQPFSLDSPLPIGNSPAPATQSPGRSSWILLLVPVGALAAVVYAGATRSSRPPRHRRLLIRLAAFDEDRAAAVDSGGGPTNETASRERERIMEQLLSQ